MTEDFNKWWDKDLLTEDNPYVDGTPDFWAWEGWQAALAAPVQDIDWKDMYEKQKRRSEMWVAKYEKDIGPLEYAVPLAAPVPVKTFHGGKPWPLHPAPVQEPVAQEPFGYFQYDIRLDAWVQNRINNKGAAFYTTTPAAQRQWVGLTNQERSECWETIPELAMKKVEAKLKEKNT